MKKILFILFTTFLVFTALIFYFDEWSSWRRNQSINRGNEIIGQLELHKNQYGEYPQSIKELDFLIEPPSAGTRIWHYEALSSRSDFSLKFGCGDYCYPAVVYTSNSGTWYLDD